MRAFSLHLLSLYPCFIYFSLDLTFAFFVFLFHFQNALNLLHKKDRPVIPPWDNTIRKLQSEIQETTGFGRERSESIAEEDESADVSDVFSRASLIS
jgi:hypothetical protein